MLRDVEPSLEIPLLSPRIAVGALPKRQPAKPLPTPVEADQSILSNASWTRVQWTRARAEWKPPADKVLAALESACEVQKLAAPRDVDFEAAAATLLVGAHVAAAFVARWLAEGVETALSCFASMWAWQRKTRSVVVATHRPGWAIRRRADGRVEPASWLASVAAEENGDSTDCGAKHVVATLLAGTVDAMSDERRADARRIAVRLREGAPLTVKMGLDCVFCDAGWALEDARSAMEEERTPPDAKLLLGILADADAAGALSRRLAAPLPAALVASRIGLPAVPLLVKAFADGDSDPTIAQVLAALECIESAKALAGRLGDRTLGPIARAFFARRPDLGLVALGPLIAGRGRMKVHAEALARELLAKHPTLLDRLARSIDRYTAAALAAVADVRSADEEAALADLPPILARDPPKSAPRDLPDIAPLPFEDVVHLSPPESESLRSPSAMTMSQYATWLPIDLVEGSPETDAYILETVLERPQTSHAQWVVAMSTPAAIKWLETTDHWLSLKDTGAILVHHGLPIVAALAARANPEAAAVLASVESPHVAVFMARVAGRGAKAAAAARAYIRRFPEASAIGLIPLALAAKTRKQGVAALQMLDPDTLSEVAERYGSDVSDALPALLETAPKLSLPSWLSEEALPAVRLEVSGARLPAAAVRRLLTLMAASHRELGAVLDACTRESLATFAWALFEAWVAAGTPKKHEWMLAMVGSLGGDEEARRLVSLLADWPPARAAVGLDVLARIGTDVALSHLDALGQRSRSQSLRERASERMAEVAAARGIDVDVLGDQIAPTLGLEEEASKVLSFGARSFRLVFDETLAPNHVDEHGHRVAALPRPRASDDPAAVHAATERWRALKNDLAVLAKNQIHRLERAMCARRTWRADTFERVLVRHPLVRHLVCRLLFAAEQRLFRVAEDGTLADVHDVIAELPPDTEILVVHPLDLSPGEQEVWGTIFADYEIAQPFPQLARETYRLEDGERDQRLLRRVCNVEVRVRRLLGLSHRGWRPAASKNGLVASLEKPLGGSLVAALELYTPFYLGGEILEKQVCHLGSITVRHGHDAPIALGELDAIVVSELVRDAEQLRL
jgi:hypothetical protein